MLLVGEGFGSFKRAELNILSQRAYMLLSVLFAYLCICGMHIIFQFILTLKSMDFKA